MLIRKNQLYQKIVKLLLPPRHLIGLINCPDYEMIETQTLEYFQFEKNKPYFIITEKSFTRK